MLSQETQENVAGIVLILSSTIISHTYFDLSYKALGFIGVWCLPLNCVQSQTIYCVLGSLIALQIDRMRI